MTALRKTGTAEEGPVWSALHGPDRSHGRRWIADFEPLREAVDGDGLRKPTPWVGRATRPGNRGDRRA